jgi:DNA-binding MarR family transcriptional regulator
MEDIQHNILLALYNYFEQNLNTLPGDKEIANSLSIDIDRVRVCLKDLQRKGYIKLEDGASLSNPEYIIVMSMTSEGRLAIKDN